MTYAILSKKLSPDFSHLRNGGGELPYTRAFTILRRKKRKEKKKERMKESKKFS
jgi:hypothetical protein